MQGTALTPVKATDRKYVFVTRSDVSREIRTWQYPRKTICSVCIRAAPLIVKKLRSWFKHPHDLIPEWKRFSYVYYDCFTSRVSVDREKHVLSLPMLMNQRVGHYHASDVNMSFTDMGVDKTHAAHNNNSTNTVSHRKHLKDIQICIHAAVIIISVLQTLK